MQLLLKIASNLKNLIEAPSIDLSKRIIHEYSLLLCFSTFTGLHNKNILSA